MESAVLRFRLQEKKSEKKKNDAWPQPALIGRAAGGGRRVVTPVPGVPTYISQQSPITVIGVPNGNALPRPTEPQESPSVSSGRGPIASKGVSVRLTILRSSAPVWSGRDAKSALQVKTL